MSISKQFLSVSVWTAISRLLGFARDVLIASLMGAGRGADIFFAAFRIPNMLRNLFGEGALQASFVPMLVERKNNSEVNFANMAFSWLMLIMLLITIAAVIAMPLIMLIIAPGFSAEPGKLAEAIDVGRLLFPYSLLICAVGFLSGVLNANHRFALAAAMPAFLNIFMIAGAVGAWHFGWAVAPALSIAVLLSGAFQIWILWSRIRSGNFGLRLVRPRGSTDMKTLGRRMLPGIVGSGAYHINVMISTILASLTPGAVSWLYYADRMIQLPFAVIGLAIGTVLLTAISKALAEGDKQLATQHQNNAITNILFWTLPAFAGLAALAEPITRILFQRGEFTAFDTAQTAGAILLLSFALPAMSLSQVFEKTLFADKNTKTPAKIGILSILGGTIAAIALYPVMGFLSVALATSLSAWARLFMLARAAHRRDLFHLDSCTILNGLVFMAAAAMMYFGLKMFEVPNLIQLGALIAVAGGAYLVGMKLFLVFMKKPG
ncbi:MAG: murein biosynthesis integral membrane protein MurJ [Rickettsiales bacterium]|jgi:putative peptidoglycan lipid II flippase|nr:murein biosynthesis integral membrane protein MurJ [Rickettsiales bacterium]